MIKILLHPSPSFLRPLSSVYRRLALVLLCIFSGLAPLLLLLTVLPAFAEQQSEGGVEIARPAPSSDVIIAGTGVTVTYVSSVDGVALEYYEYLPTGYTSTVAYPLVILLHGAGGNMRQYDTTEWRSAADAHGAILAMAHARVLPPPYSPSRLSFYMDGALVPAEQDVLDLLPVATARHLTNPARIYIAGYSMGGVGAFNLATLNPGVFAASAPGTIMSDLFQQDDYSPVANLDALLGGPYTQTAAIKTYYYQNSPRFLISNLMHTPIRVVHGISDTLIPNATSTWPYMESRHIVDTPGFTDSRGRAYTLPEMAAVWPGSFYEEHLWPQLDHGAGVLSWTAESVLTFFDAHTLITNPTTVGFTTYEDKHTEAYWLQLNLTQPWTATPGQVYATRNSLANSVQLQVTGSMTITLDMPMMGLTSTLPLTAVVQSVNGLLPAGDLALTLSGTWPTGGGTTYVVKKDGVSLPVSAYAVQPTSFTLLRQTTNLTHTYTIAVSTSPPFTPTAWVWLPLVRR